MRPQPRSAGHNASWRDALAWMSGPLAPSRVTDASTRPGSVTADGHLDAGAWHEQRHRCYVRRFWAGEPDRIGHLVHRRGGSGGATWCFEYNDVIGAEAEAGHHLQQHRFVPGEYVSILQDDEELKTFKVADVRKVCAGRGALRS